MKNLLTQTKLALAITAVTLMAQISGAQGATQGTIAAQDPVQIAMPNNTRTFLLPTQNYDGVIVPIGGYVWRHLYGQEILLKLYIKDINYHKELYVVGNNRAEQVHFVAGVSEFTEGGSKALFVGKEGEYDIIYIKISGAYPVSAVGTVNYLHFALYVKMGNSQYVLGSIRLGIN